MDYFFDKDFIDLEKGRVEAREKVTGKAKYSAEYDIPRLAHAVMAGSTIASGKILNINLEKAKEAPGVIEILTHQNRPEVPGLASEEAWKESRFSLPVFHTDKIYYSDQPIAMVIAETFEDATYAASLIDAEYEIQDFKADFDASEEKQYEETGEEIGSLSEWKNSEYMVDAEYKVAMEVHNPMEPHATIASFDGDELTLYDKSQNVYGVQDLISKLFNFKTENIHVVSEFVGGGFGAGLLVWPHTVAAIMGAQQTGRPIKIVLTRPQMFTSVGHRPESWQRFKIASDAEGNFLGVHHQAAHPHDTYAGHWDNITGITRKVYEFPNIKTQQATKALNIPKPTWMRGPGDVTGAYGMESAVDELCEKLDMDPVEVRLKNLSTKDADGKPWSTNYLNECIKIGAEKIGWKSNWNSTPGAVSDGNWKIGYGMSAGLWNARRSKADASIEMKPDGSIIVRSAMTDIGTGTGTAMQNMAHTFLGIPKNKIAIELGDSDLPYAPSQGGSKGLSSLSGGISEASKAFKKKLAEYAFGSKIENDQGVFDIKLTAEGVSKDSNSEIISYRKIFEDNSLNRSYVETSSAPESEEEKEYSFCSAAAHFVKVRVNPLTGDVKVEKMIIVADGGKIINEMAAANQIIGAGIGGIGMALMEDQKIDKKYGRLLGADLAGYHFPVNADAPMIDASFIGKPDYRRNPAGAKGLGEVGLVGNAAAITNAIYNAIGKRMRDLPVTPDKILMA